MNPNLFNELLSSDSFEENLKSLTDKIKELKPLIDAQGGIKTIEKLTREAQSKAEIANFTLTKAKAESEQILTEAKRKAQEIEQDALERANQVKALADRAMKESNEKLQEIKKSKTELEKGWKILETDGAKLLKDIHDLDIRESKLKEVEELLAKLKIAI